MCSPAEYLHKDVPWGTMGQALVMICAWEVNTLVPPFGTSVGRFGSLYWKAPLHMQRCPFESKRHQRPVRASSYEESVLSLLRVQIRRLVNERNQIACMESLRVTESWTANSNFQALQFERSYMILT